MRLQHLHHTLLGVFWLARAIQRLRGVKIQRANRGTQVHAGFHEAWPYVELRRSKAFLSINSPGTFVVSGPTWAYIVRYCTYTVHVISGWTGVRSRNSRFFPELKPRRSAGGAPFAWEHGRAEIWYLITGDACPSSPSSRQRPTLFVPRDGFDVSHDDNARFSNLLARLVSSSSARRNFPMWQFVILMTRGSRLRVRRQGKFSANCSRRPRSRWIFRERLKIPNFLPSSR